MTRSSNDIVIKCELMRKKDENAQEFEFDKVISANTKVFACKLMETTVFVPDYN